MLSEAMNIEDRLRSDLQQARKQRDDLAVEAIRMLMSVADNAGAVDLGPWESSHLGGPTEVPRRHVTEREVLELFRAEADDFRAAAAEYRRHGQAEAADDMEIRARVVERYLV
jgi:uncharacterized protein YqeY